MSPAPAQVKSCCAAAYSGATARWLLGDSFHPGGARLTSRLASALQVNTGDMVIDVASGPGTSALQVAKETGCDVLGIDLSAENVEDATHAASSAGLAERVRFIQGDAEALPVADESADGAICECALCTFPDKAMAAEQFTRVLRPGARVAISDITALPDQLPPELTSLQAWVACIADARPLEEIASLLQDGGLIVERTERHDHELGAMLARVDARLKAARLIGAGMLYPQIATGRELVAAAQLALARGMLGYGVVIARKP
ncbi:methyltransferase domain-containing protein [Paraconexibacter antarcticus]|uniref:Methyltransferase domain-containing protein n=1 Tax=Paraconexibacter antarcticus TaxID=2949664 RepID=A0ABY5DPL7_9ACTN|nr:methyltransferase domain-containing protein [Paraconexibacter antarcticus]UTI63981.1 methyltransferase domain-containing protein [Paraconexibacter antarcticus]